MNKYIKTNKGYYYKILKNGKNIISEKKYYNKNKKILYGGTVIENFITHLGNSKNKKSNLERFKNMYQSIIQSEENRNRVGEYDLKFISSIFYLMYGDSTTPYHYYIIKNGVRKQKTINFSSILYNDKKYGKTQEKRLQFFKEDIYEMSPNEIIDEYEEFVKNGFISKKFFKSNVANIAMLIQCYDRRCYDKYLSRIGRKNNKSFISEEDLNEIYSIFLHNYKENLIKLLVKAYLTCSYTDICELYKEFLLCYRDTYCKYLKNITIFLKNIDSTFSDIDSISIFEISSMYCQKIIQVINNSLENNFFVYLSCIHVSENKQANLYNTRFIDSYIGHLDVHGHVFNIFDIILHDLYLHGNLKRLLNMNDRILDINRDFIKRLYEYSINLDNIDIYNYGMFIIQIIQNEIIGLKKNVGNVEMLILNEEFFSYLVNSFISYKRFIHKYSKKFNNNINLFKEFLSFVHKISSSKYRAYNILQKKNNSSTILEIKLNNNNTLLPPLMPFIEQHINNINSNTKYEKINIENIKKYNEILTKIYFRILEKRPEISIYQQKFDKKFLSSYVKPIISSLKNSLNGSNNKEIEKICDYIIETSTKEKISKN